MSGTTVKMPPEFTANHCENVAGLVQYRIDRCIERHGSRVAALEAGDIGLSIGHMESVVDALNKAAAEIRGLSAALTADTTDTGGGDMNETLCPWCGAYSRRSCEMEEDMGFCPWDEPEPDPDILREDRDEQRQMAREARDAESSHASRIGWPKTYID